MSLNPLRWIASLFLKAFKAEVEVYQDTVQAAQDYINSRLRRLESIPQEFTEINDALLNVKGEIGRVHKQIHDAGETTRILCAVTTPEKYQELLDALAKFHKRADRMEELYSKVKRFL
jgi:predicted  nucleic acid-binding Zn-ribbon protein